jgi:cell division protein FtsW
MPGMVVMGVFLLLVLLQPDFGSMVLIALTLLLMIFVGGAKPGHILASLSGLLVLGGFLIASQAYRMKRFLVFLNPWQDPQDTGFQIIQSYLAIGNGGLFGVGLGDSRQKLFFLPDAHTDFIFSILAEELGLLGVLAVMFLFGCFVWRGFRACLAAQDDFSRYLGYGITTLFGLQIILNLAVVMGMMPTKGLPLPFISLGGSSLVLSLFMTGVLLNIGRRATPWSGGALAGGDFRRGLR